jgi:hypothetical protein
MIMNLESFVIVRRQERDERADGVGGRLPKSNVKDCY